MTGTLLTLLLCAGGEPSRVTLVFGGDVIPHAPLKDAVRAAAGQRPEAEEEEWAKTLAPLSGFFASGDLALVNLEAPLVDGKRPYQGEWIFSAPPALARGLKRAGVGAVSFSNNHARDQHLDGIVRTRALLEDAGLAAVGAHADQERAWAPLVLELQGVRVGFLGFTRFLNRFQNRRDPKAPHVPFVPYASEPRDGGFTEAQLLEKVKAARAQCEVLVVLPHWGHESEEVPRASDRALAAALLAAGASAVVGTHPHVPQPLQWVPGAGGDALVAYSLGNLVSNQAPTDVADPRRSGLLLALTLEKTGAGVRLTHARAVPVFTENLPARGGRTAQALPLADAVEAWQQKALAATGKGARWARARAAALERAQARLSALVGALEAGPAAAAAK